MLRQLSRQIGFACAWRPIKNGLLLPFHRPHPAHEFCFREARFRGALLYRVRRAAFYLAVVRLMQGNACRLGNVIQGGGHIQFHLRPQIQPARARLALTGAYPDEALQIHHILRRK